MAVFSVIRGPVYNSLGYNKDDKVESYGIPIQQVCYIIENNGDVSESEKEVINSILYHLKSCIKYIVHLLLIG